MTLRNLLLSYSTVFSLLANAQTPANKQFDSYAHNQDSLMVNAYDHKDVNSYTKLLNEFLEKYDNLSKEDKISFKTYYFNAYYNLCCTYSLANDKSKEYDYLDKSIKAGYWDYEHLKTDKDLDNIRFEEQYKKLVQPLRETGDFMYILKKAAKYNPNEKRELPAFTYQSADNPNLVSLRKAFNLDSIAGGGNDVSKILNLMHWIHNLVPHDGSHGNPEVMNALNMIAVCKNDKRGLNCRGLATVLNECYLAMGFKSRFLTCLPKDSLGVDQDCHVIDMVYSNQLKKWLWIDPTFDAYMMNEKGELLSVEEVRERLINDKPLILNPDANWNRKNSQTKENYLYSYMAKNLYLLECPISSEYNTETRQENKVINYMDLVPLDYFKKSLNKKESTNNENKTTFITYKTNNPDVFWKAP